MIKKTVQNIVNSIPETLKIATSYFKEHFDNNGQDALGNMTGATSILIKIFAQDKIDNYFEKITEDKLKDFGSKMYLKASFIQVSKSLEVIKIDELTENGDMVYGLIKDTFIDNKVLNTKDVLTIFNPIYHPIIVDIKNKLKLALKTLDVSETIINKFIRDFNENIKGTLIKNFGEDDYKKHLEDTKYFLLEKNEARLLWDTYQLHKIGFKEEECLEYEDTYAKWKPVSSLFEIDNDENYQKNRKLKFSSKNIVKEEESLKLAENLVDEYFEHFDNIEASNYLKNILFIIADFGKGKSVFMKQYASKLAKSYIETKEGYFPIYFNLREYSKYSSNGTLGFLSDYLLTDYQIEINDDYFREKKYIFLVDSLDESGELTTNAINKVIESIKNIQNIDKVKSVKNKIIVTSRPFSDGLDKHLKFHEPFELGESISKTPQFMSIYGFKTQQFNHWLYSSLKSYENLNMISTTGFAKEIVNSILNNNKEVNIYEKLLNENTLSEAELRRPIFAYMIFQLIINNVDFLKIGKIGVYLSFLNLLTKEAKHINDKSCEVNLSDEIKYRNILHSISALWMKERAKGQQGVLKKADIYRVLEGSKIEENDNKVLDKYNKNSVNEIKFLSHSYFGENNNLLHFQHQSFAEILLAEYYLKVFIKFALDKKRDILEARSKLILGEPTEQTILFFVELVRLLKDSVSSDNNKDIIEKRKLLYPLFASLALEEHNPIYSNDLYYDWFKKGVFDSDSLEYPKELLINWAITEEKLEKVVDLASKIIDCNNSLLMTRTSHKNSLFDHEITVFENKFVSDISTDIDKWLALTVGNVLETNIDDKKFFNTRLLNPENLFEMIRNWNYSNNTSSPEWCKEYFMGIKRKGDTIVNMVNLDLSGVNFSYSILENINLNNTECYKTIFNNCIFNQLTISHSFLYKSSFDNIDLKRDTSHDYYLSIGYSNISRDLYMPINLADYLFRGSIVKKRVIPKTFIIQANYSYNSNNNYNYNYNYDFFNTLKGLLYFGLKKELFDITEIKTWFTYEDAEAREDFEKLIDTLEDKP